MTSNFRTLVLYLLANILPQLLTFVLLPLYGRAFSIEEYGLIGLLEVVSYISLAIITLSLERSAIRFYSTCNSENEIKTIYGAIFYGATVIGFVFLAFGIAILMMLPDYFVSKLVVYSSIIIFSIYLKSLFLIVCRYYQARKFAGKFFVFQLGRVLLEFSLLIFFIAFMKLGVEGYVYGLLITSLMSVPVIVLVVWRNFSIDFDRQQLYRVLKYSIPFVPTVMSAWIFNMYGRVAVEFFEGVEAVGLYSMGYKLASASILIVTAIQMSYTPIFLDLAKDNENGRNYINAYTELINKTLIFGFFVMVFFFSEYIELLVSEKYLSVSTIGVLFSLTFYVSSIMSLTSNLVFSEKEKTLQHMNIYLVFSLVALVVISLGTYIFGVYGAVVGQLVSMCCLYYIHVKEARKLFDIRIMSIEKLVLVSLGLGFIGWIGSKGYQFLSFNYLLLILVKICFVFVVLFFYCTSLVRYKFLLKAGS